MKTLIAFFSHKGDSFVHGQILALAIGNTEVVANKIKGILGGTLFEIESKHPYSIDYHACTKEVVQEMNEQARPPLKTLPATIEEYDMIFIGYPNWCGTMPMPVCTFLTSFDFSYKNLAPFCTHGGSGIGHSVRDIKLLCPTAHVLPSLAILGAQATQSDAAISTWLESLHLR